jgi:hypothetical protein
MFEATSVFVWLVQQRSLYSLLGMMNAFFGKNIFTGRVWKGTNGELVIIPKDEGNTK